MRLYILLLFICLIVSRFDGSYAAMELVHTAFGCFDFAYCWAARREKKTLERCNGPICLGIPLGTERK